MPEIEGGYYIKARKIQESEIAYAPPHVREIWDWLIKEANHKDNKGFKRGQTMRSLKDMQEGLKWFIGYRKMTYSKSNCEMATNWLRKRGMITTAKTTRGMIITVLNYDTYQNPKNYESNNEKSTKATTNEQPSDTINNNDNNEKNEKKEAIVQAKPETDLFNISRNFFINYTKEHVNPSYIFDAKEGKHLKLLLSKLKNTAKNPNVTNEELFNGFQFLITNATDEWLREHWELSILNSQYNKVILFLRKQQKGTNSLDSIINAIS